MIADRLGQACHPTRTAALFLRQFVQSPRTVGAVLPSSAALARAMLAPIDFASARTIVEFGPGTGAFTREIAARLTPECRYLGIELNPRIRSQALRRHSRASPSFTAAPPIWPRSSRRRASTGRRDRVRLPWATLPISLQETVFAAMDRALVPGGVFVTFGYLQSLVLPGAWALRRRLRRSFAEVGRSPVVWGNVPPAFAYICRKRM